MRTDNAGLPDEDHYRMVTHDPGDLVVFLGAGAHADERNKPWSADSGTVPDDQELANYLASSIQLKDPPLHLAEVAQCAAEIYGEMELFHRVTQVLRVYLEPGPVYRCLAGLPARLGRSCQMIITPNYDTVLERALMDQAEAFDVAVYMASGTAQAGRFVHVPWEGSPRLIDKPAEYTGFPIDAEDHRLQRTVIVKINGSVDDPSGGFPWENNYVITEDHYIDYLTGRSPEEVMPGQILAKLKNAYFLFLGYPIADWRMRVFLQWIWEGPRLWLGRSRAWAVEHEPNMLARDLWNQAGVTLYQTRLTDYVKGLNDFIDCHPEHFDPNFWRS